MAVEVLTDVGASDFLQDFRSEVGFHADLLPRFRDFLILDLATSEYLSQLNQKEELIDGGHVAALKFIRPIIKKVTFAAFSDILDYGSDRETLEALELLEFYNIYQREGIGEIEKIVGKEKMERALDDIELFQKKLQSLDYENMYVHRYPR